MGNKQKHKPCTNPQGALFRSVHSGIFVCIPINLKDMLGL